MLRVQGAYCFINAFSAALYSDINDFIDCLCISFSGVVLNLLIILDRAMRSSWSNIMANERRSLCNA